MGPEADAEDVVAQVFRELKEDFAERYISIDKN